MPAPEKIWRLDWVDVGEAQCCCCVMGTPTPGQPIASKRLIRETPNPCLAAIINIAGLSWIMPSLYPYSTCFRVNQDDSLIFSGLSYVPFTGFRSNKVLRDVMLTRPRALEHLDEFDKAAAVTGVLETASPVLQWGGLAAMVAALFVSANHPRTAGYLFWGGLSGGVVGVGASVANDFTKARAFGHLLEALTEFNGGP